MRAELAEFPHSDNPVYQALFLLASWRTSRRWYACQEMRKQTWFSLTGAILSCLLLAGCRPLPLLSYPWFWDYTKTKPTEGDVTGTYKIFKLRLPSELGVDVRQRNTGITLESDHTAVLSDFPEFNDAGDKLVCTLSGNAKWSFDNEISSLGWSVVFQDYHPLNTPSASECVYENRLWGIFILNQRVPYRFYLNVGDPDSDTGVEFKRVGR